VEVPVFGFLNGLVRLCAWREGPFVRVGQKQTLHLGISATSSQSNIHVKRK
jgi:hypothetical protein